MAGKIFMAVLVAVFFIGCSPTFLEFSENENSPVYYDEGTKTKSLKSGACALRFNTKLDLSRLDENSKKQYLSRFRLGSNPDFCYKNKVVQITEYMMELYYDIPCTCIGQIMRK